MFPKNEEKILCILAIKPKAEARRQILSHYFIQVIIENLICISILSYRIKKKQLVLS